MGQKYNIVEIAKALLIDFSGDIYGDFQEKEEYSSSECLSIVRNRLNEYLRNLNGID